MGDVVFGRFSGQGGSGNAAYAGTAATAADQPQPGAQELTQHPLKSFEQSFTSQTHVLSELASLLADPRVEPGIASPLFSELVALQAAGNKIAQKLAQASGDDNAFLSVQGDLRGWLQEVALFERKVLDKTDHEIVETTGEIVGGPAPVLSATPVQKKFPLVWFGVGMVAVSGLTWLAVAKLNAPKKRARTPKAPPEEKFKKVKLKRALPAR